MKKYLLGLLLLIGIGFLPSTAFSQIRWKKELLDYIRNNLAKTDGGYGWEDQYDSHLTPTYAVTGILYDIGELPDNKNKITEFIRTHHPQKGPNKEAGQSGSQLRNLTYQQIQSILWLGGDVSSLISEVDQWKSQAGILANYEGNGFAVLMQEMLTPICRQLLKLPLSDTKKEVETYLALHRRKNGSFNNAPTDFGGDGNILSTYWALAALNATGSGISLDKQTIAWLQSCQLKNGGFTHQPNPQIGVNDEVIYTWAAVKSLILLNTKPEDLKGCINYLLSLRNADGGFGNRPGVPSNPVSTYYAIDALKALDALSSLDKVKARRTISGNPLSFSGYNIYTVQFEASGSGSPEEAVMLADSLKIHLWGAKNAEPDWVTRAQNIADEKKVSVTFFTSNEPYNKNITIPGMGTFGHILDYITPPNSEIVFKNSSPFNEFKNSTHESIKKANGGLILQVSNNEPMARILLDESVNNGFYSAISTIHFSQNFAFWLPYLMEYRYQLPLVSLQDAHGTESWWWSNDLVNHRTLFIAKEPTYNGLMNALKNNWIIAVRHDSLSDYKTRAIGGVSSARNFILKKQNTWQWWYKNNETTRPWAAITILSPEDKFESGHPEKGVTIRVRCWWNTVRQYLKSPAVELKELRIDGKTVDARLINLKTDKGDLTDSYYLYSIGYLQKGNHIVNATLRRVKDGSIKIVTTSFNQN